MQNSLAKRENRELGHNRNGMKNCGVQRTQKSNCPSLLKKLKSCLKEEGNLKDLFYVRIIIAHSNCAQPNWYGYIQSIVGCNQNPEHELVQICLGEVRERFDNLEQEKKSKCVGGCMLILQLIYFHRLRWKGSKLQCGNVCSKRWQQRKTHEEDLVWVSGM